MWDTVGAWETSVIEKDDQRAAWKQKRVTKRLRKIHKLRVKE